MRPICWLLVTIGCSIALLLGSWQLLPQPAQGAAQTVLAQARPTVAPFAVAEPVTVTFAAPALRAALSQVRHAASQSQARPALTGVLFEVAGGEAQLVATDGVRLALLSIAAVRPATAKLRAVLPAALVDELLETLASHNEKVELTWLPAQNRVRATVDGAVLDAPLPNGVYPDLSSMRSLTYTTAITVARAALLTALHAGADGLRSETPVLSLAVGGRDAQGWIELATSAHTAADAHWPRRLPAAVTGPPQQVLLNGRLLAAAVRSLHTPVIVIDLRGSTYPLRVRASDSALRNERILMPMNP